MTRRSNHEGTIRHRDDGTWEGRIRLPGGVRKSVYGATRKVVSEKIHTLLNEMENGNSFKDRDVLTSAVLNDWYHSVQYSLRPSTVRTYHYIIETHLLPSLGFIKVRELTPWHIEQVLQQKQDSGLSPRTVHHIRAVLRAGLAKAVRWQIVSRNVAELAKAPRVSKKALNPFSADELQRILEATKGTDIGPIVDVAIHLGLRQGEILGLRWKDIDFQNNLINVTSTLQFNDSSYQLLSTKTSSGIRSIPMPNHISEVLRSRKEEQNQQRETACELWNEPIADMVFTSNIGTPRNGPTITHLFHKALVRAGVERRSFHTLRHSWATLALSQGVDLKTISSLLGHSQISITADTYAWVLPSLQRAANDTVRTSLEKNT